MIAAVPTHCRKLGVKRFTLTHLKYLGCTQPKPTADTVGFMRGRLHSCELTYSHGSGPQTAVASAKRSRAGRTCCNL